MITNLKIFIFIILSFFLTSSSITDSKKKEPIYILIDKRSEKIDYREGDWCRNETKVKDIFFTLKTYGRDNIIKVTFGCLDPKIDYYAFDMVKDVNFKRQNMPISFLDTIKYYTEVDILNAGLEFEKKLGKSQIFILDKGTIKNDSIMMYGATFRYTGFEE